jgi:4-amino-4-deoxy-L-arabinose transferase-like glycosyltransferase
MKLHKKNSRVVYIIYFLLASIGGYLAFHAMTWGPWAFSDSSAYVGAARSIASGNGLVILQSTGNVKTLTEFPPLFPVLLSILGGNKLDYISTIRWCNIFLFSSSIFIFSQTIYTATRKHFLSIIATLVFISSPQIITTYTSAMSEPLFLLLLLLSLFLLLLIFQKDVKILRISFYVVSSLLPITRYAGILFVGIFGIGLFTFSRKTSLFMRIKNTILYYFIAFLPVGLWGLSFLYKFNIYGGKRFSFDVTIFNDIARSIIEELMIIKLWIPYVELYLDTFTEALIISIVSIFVISLIGWTIKQFSFPNIVIESNKKHFFFLTIQLILGYVFFIGFTHSIAVPQIDIINRMMIPIYPLWIIIIFMSLDILIRKIEYRIFITIFIIALSFIGLRYNSLRTNSYIRAMSANGYGFTARAYQQSGLINEIQKIPDDREMISNLSGFVLFYTNRYPIQVNNFPNYSFGSGNTYGEKPFRENRAALIILFSDFSNYYGEDSENLLFSLTNTLNAKYVDTEGGIYLYQ